MGSIREKVKVRAARTPLCSVASRMATYSVQCSQVPGRARDARKLRSVRWKFERRMYGEVTGQEHLEWSIAIAADVLVWVNALSAEQQWM
jgi:hypothetical protein